MRSSVFFKRSIGRFLICHNLPFFNHFWKNTHGVVFSTQWIFEHLPPSAVNVVPKKNWSNLFFGKTCRIGKQLYIFVQKISPLLNYDRHSHFSKSVAFYGNFTTCNAYLKGMFVCICMTRGYQGATKGLILIFLKD